MKVASTATNIVTVDQPGSARVAALVMATMASITAEAAAEEGVPTVADIKYDFAGHTTAHTRSVTLLH
jgi:hypothetical protein